MDTEKIQLIQTFNLQRFFDWQSLFYENLPGWVEDEIKAKEKKEFEAWEKLVDRIRKGLPNSQENEKNEISEAAKNAIEAHDKRQIQIELYQKMKMEILDFDTFQVVKSTVENSIQTEIKELTEKVNRGVSTPKRIFEKRLEYGLELIDTNLLEWMANEHPILQKHGIFTISTLSEVGMCQWVLEKLNQDETTVPPISAGGVDRLPAPLRWTGQKNTLAAFFGELKRLGFVQGSTEKMAEWIAIMFENAGKAKTIDKDLRNSTLPKKDAEKIIAFYADVTKYDKEAGEN